MARSHGKDCRFYINGSDLSAQTVDVSISDGAEIHDATTFASSGNRVFDAGFRASEWSVSLFHDAAAGQEDPVLSPLVGAAPTNVLSLLFDDADALGEYGVILGASELRDYNAEIVVEDLMKKSGVFQSSDFGGRARLLHALGAETATGTSATVDDATSSAAGAIANLHVTAATGAWTLKVQDSPNDSAWSDLITFTSVTAAGGQTGSVAGTVDRYVRASFTETSSGSCTFAISLARK